MNGGEGVVSRGGGRKRFCCTGIEGLTVSDPAATCTALRSAATHHTRVVLRPDGVSWALRWGEHRGGVHQRLQL